MNHNYLKEPYSPGEVNPEVKITVDYIPSLPEQGQYLPDEKTAHAVNLALRLGVPLLITGEPGVGKTSLADSVAERLGWGKNRKALRFQVKSDSEAKDALYYFDALSRLYDAQHNLSDKKAQINDPKKYRKLEPLGQAIQEAQEEKRPNVVLIDEIDKASNDFPNGLLMELDEWKFSIPETGESYELTKDDDPRPLVIITSNSERRLPDPFLRRCLVHEIERPDEERMFTIMKQRLFGQIEEEVLIKALEHFFEFHKKKDELSLLKLPSSGDLLMWLRSLVINRITLKELDVALSDKIPNLTALIKHWEDIQRIQEYSK